MKTRSQMLWDFSWMLYGKVPCRLVQNRSVFLWMDMERRVVHHMNIIAYDRDATVWRLSINHLALHHEVVEKALGPMFGPIVRRHGDHAAKLELSFAPAQASEVARRVASWIPDWGVRPIPIDTQFFAPIGGADDMNEVGYIWTRLGEEVYEPTRRRIQEQMERRRAAVV